MKMSTIYKSYAVTLSDTARSEDLTKSIQYVQEVTSTLAGYRQASKPTPVANKSVRNQDLVDALAKNQGAPGRNLVTCGKFDGGNTDAFVFLAWFSQFENMLASGRPMAGRYNLAALCNHLTHTGLAYKLIQTLEITDDNYDVAVEILKEEFLDVEKIVDKLCDQILEKSPKYDAEFEHVRLYVAEIKAILNDLNKSYNVDLISPDTGGYKFVSHIMFSKLPPVVQKAIIEKVSSNYPTLDDIFDNIKDIIEKLVKTKPKKVENFEPDFNHNSKSNIEFGLAETDMPVDHVQSIIESSYEDYVDPAEAGAVHI